MKFAKVLTLALTSLSLFAATAHAEDGDVVVVDWFDNFTFGAVNTAIGPFAAGTGYIYNAAAGRHPHLGFRFDKTHQQLVLEDSSPNSWEFSLGAFHINEIKHGPKKASEPHESGHAKQSSILGPLYLPTVGLSYLLVHHDSRHQPLEDWATAWADLGASLQTGSRTTLSLEMRDRDGRKTTTTHTGNVAVERTSRLNIDDRYATAVSYQYGGLDIGLTLQGTNCTNGSASSIEGTLFRKDFLAEWSVVSGLLTLLIDSKQVTGDFAMDFERQTLNVNFLSHELGYGVRLGDRRTLALDLTGRGRYALKGIWDLGQEAHSTTDVKAPGFFATAGVGGEVRVHVLDGVELYGRKDIDWGTGGYGDRSTIVGIQTPDLFRANRYTSVPMTHKDPTPEQIAENRSHKRPGIDATRLAGNVYEEEEDQTLPATGGGAKTTHIKTTWFTIKGRW